MYIPGVLLSDDGLALRGIKHPWSFKWWFKSLFRRPKFSAAALEPAETIKISEMPMPNFQFAFQECDCEACEKIAFMEMINLVEKNFGRDALNYNHPLIKKYVEKN